LSTSWTNIPYSQLNEFDGKKLVCVSKEGLEVKVGDGQKKARKAEAAEFADLCTTIKDAPCDNVEERAMYPIVFRPHYWSFGWSSSFNFLHYIFSTSIGTYYESSGPPYLKQKFKETNLSGT
jgi:hypothetical protein